MQKAVSVESVVDPAATPGVKFKAHFGTPRRDGLANLRLLLWGGPVLLSQMLTQVLPLWAHVGVQLKGLKVQIGLHLAIQIGQGGLKCAQTHGTPRTGDVRNEINLQKGGHGGLTK
jgi:hypothetical protein